MKNRTAALLACLFLLMTGCAEKNELHSSYLLAMDTVMEFKVYGAHGEDGIEKITEMIEALEDTLSVTDERSQVYGLNAEGSLTQADPHLTNLLNLSMELGNSTEGALDITVYPIVNAWGFTGDTYRVPEEEELKELLAHVDYTAVVWDGATVSLPEGCQIDLGSLAKGYAGAMAADVLREMGVTSALLNLGGNVQTVGAKPDGSPWRIAVKDPLEPDGTSGLGVLELTDRAAVTSGGYERCFEENGEIYWHIIDPDTGFPADSGLLSVTVVGEDGALCDGLSTALFIMGKDKALALWQARRDFEVVLVEESGVVTVTGGLADSFTLTNDRYTLDVVK